MTSKNAAFAGTRKMSHYPGVDLVPSMFRTRPDSVQARLAPEALHSIAH
jgi:hypothetical protein